MSTHIVITGGAGFIGSALCRALLERGDCVTVIDDLCTGRSENIADIADHPQFTFRRSDITTAVAFAGLADVTGVVHLACPASPRANSAMPIATMRAASQGTLNALELAHKHDARIVVASSSEVYGDPQTHPQREDYRGNCDPIGRFAPYMEGKRFTEAAAAVYHRDGARVGIVRPFNVFGPGMWPNDGRVVAAFCAAALRGETLQIQGGTQTRSFVYIDDFVKAMTAMLDVEEFGPINIGNEDSEIAIADLAHLVVELAGQGKVDVTASRDADIAVRRPDISRARELLDWQATTTLREGLLYTLDWMRTIIGSDAVAVR